MKRLIDKDALLDDINFEIQHFEVKDEVDQAFLNGVMAVRRIVKFMPAQEVDE